MDALVQAPLIPGSTDRLIGERERRSITSVSRATWARLEAQGAAPRRVRLAPGRIAWSFAEVMKWVEAQKELRDPAADAGTEGERCLAHLLSATVNGSTVGEWVALAVGRCPDDDRVPHATGTLKDHGILIMSGYIGVANSHPALARILADTPWAGGWGTYRSWARALRQLPGAGASVRCHRFGEHIQRCTLLPLAVALQEPQGSARAAPTLGDRHVSA